MHTVIIANAWIMMEYTVSSWNHSFNKRIQIANRGACEVLQRPEGQVWSVVIGSVLKITIMNLRNI